MKKISILFLAIFLLVGCAQSLEQTGEEENQSVDIFEKNQECFKYKEEVQIRNHIDPKNEYVDENGVISSIFYSPKANSCLYINKRGFAEGLWSDYLVDVFTNKNISVANYYLPTDDMETYYKTTEDFENLVREYQN